MLFDFAIKIQGSTQNVYPSKIQLKEVTIYTIVKVLIYLDICKNINLVS